jgi:hypothetical protein
MPDAAIAQLKGRYGPRSREPAPSGDRGAGASGTAPASVPLVVGAAFPRTGTNSLKLALEQLGFGPCYHIQEMCVRGHLPLWDVPDASYDGQRRDGYGAFPTLPDFDAILGDGGFRSGVDVPFCLFWEDLYRARPGAKVVLTLRDPESWYRSCRDTIWKHAGLPRDRRLAYEAIPELKALWEWEVKTHWGAGAWRFEDKASAIGAYLAYQDRVRRSVPPADLLEFSPKDGWSPLCDFLGVEPPADGRPFPHVNDTAAQLAEAEKIDAIGRAVREAAAP